MPIEKNNYALGSPFHAYTMPVEAPQLTIITTPIEDDGDGDCSTTDYIDKLASFAFTPSPQGIDEFDNSANRSDVVSKLLLDHLVSPRDDVIVDDDEIIVTSKRVTLPELEDATATTNSSNDGDGTISAEGSHANYSPECPSPKNTPPVLVQHKMLYQSVHAFASPIHPADCLPQLTVGPEREVLFHTDGLGIKLSRHTDGYVRVLSVTPYRAMDPGFANVREGHIHEGDVVREVGDVNLRCPIDSAVWKMAVGLIKVAPRPLKFVVAKEVDVCDDDVDFAPMDPGGMPWASDATTGSSQTSTSHSESRMDGRFGPTREAIFLEPCLGVKLHRNSEGYVQILSVTPYKSFPNSPNLVRTGDIEAGDIVLDVGKGAWDLREPIDAPSWGDLIRYIKETPRPLSMIVADEDSLNRVPTIAEEEGESPAEERSPG